MKIYFLSIFIFIHGVICPSSGSAKESPDESIPTEISPIDLKHLQLDLSFDLIKQQASGDAILTFSPTVSLDSIVLDCKMLSIHSVRIKNGRSLKYAYRSSEELDKIIIKLDRVYRSGETLAVVISYNTNYVNATDPANIAGSNGKGIRFFRPSSTEPNRYLQAWSMGEGDGNAYWYPCTNNQFDLRTTEFTGIVQKPLTLITNGKLLDRKDSSNGTTKFHYRMDEPYPNYKTAFVIGEYVQLKTLHGKTELHQYAYPVEREAAIATVERLPDMTDFFTRITGQQFPYKIYSQVFVQELPWGVSSSGFSTLSENMIDDHPTHADYLYLWDMLEGEALASQWFGSLVSCKNWNNYWLNKAFSRYFSCLYDEYRNGKDEYLLWQLTFDQGNYFNDWYAGNRQPVVTRVVSDLQSYINGNYPNSRGALVLHMLRKELGENDWRKSIQFYLKRNKGKTVITEDLVNALQSATGKNMSWFFDQWIYKIGHPVFEAKRKYNANSQQLILTLRQTQKQDLSAYPQNLFFRGRMQIEIDDRVETITIEDKEENVFVFNSPGEPRFVNIDFESSWIKELTFEKPLKELLLELEFSRDVLARNSALGALADYAKSDSTSSTDKEKIDVAYRKTILGDNYWRLRYNAMLWHQNVLVSRAGKKPIVFDADTKKMLLQIISQDSSWVKASAIGLLGMAKDSSNAEVFIDELKDKSERVVNTASIALGKCKSSRAFELLVKLKDKPSWKNQSLISSLNGLAQLGDKRGAEIALQYINASHLPHWTLATPTWDHRLAASQTLVALDEGSKGFLLIKKDFEKSLEENNTNDIFYNLLQMVTLKDIRAQSCFDKLIEMYKNDPAFLNATKALESHFKAGVKQ